jgi:hypothetical protein
VSLAFVRLTEPAINPILVVLEYIERYPSLTAVHLDNHSIRVNKK